MKTLNVYLTFDGECEAALNFYKACLGGEITMQKFGDAPMPCSEEQKDKVMHAEFRTEGIYLMASDSMENYALNKGNNVSLSISLDDETLQTSIFEKLSTGGQVTMSLQDTFWGARFGMLVDRFGIQWMFNCEKPKS